MHADPGSARPPEGKIRYKAVYRDPNASPFAPRITTPTKTLDVDAGVPREEVEKMARDAQENYEFVRLEIVSQ